MQRCFAHFLLKSEFAFFRFILIVFLFSWLFTTIFHQLLLVRSQAQQQQSSSLKHHQLQNVDFFEPSPSNQALVMGEEPKRIALLLNYFGTAGDGPSGQDFDNFDNFIEKAWNGSTQCRHNLTIFILVSSQIKPPLWAKLKQKLGQVEIDCVPFTGPSSLVQFQMLQLANDQGNNLHVVVVEKSNKDDDEDSVNFVKKYVDSPDVGQIFQTFTHIFHLSLRSIRFKHVVDLSNLWSSSLSHVGGVAFALDSSIGTRGKWSRNSVLFTHHLFGGSSQFFRGLCQRLSSSTRIATDFDYFIKAYNQANFLVKLGHLAMPSFYTFSAATDRIEIIESQQVKAARQRSEIVAAIEKDAHRVEKAKLVEMAIKQKYFESIKFDENAKFVTIPCKEFPFRIMPKRNVPFQYDAPYHGQLACTGLGDRFRGVVTGLYLAIALGRLFKIDWDPPADISQFFQINEKLYPAELANKYKIAEENSNFQSYMLNRSNSYFILHNSDFNEWPLISLLANVSFPTEKAPRYDNIYYMSNRWAGLEGVVQNVNNRPRFKAIFPEQVLNFHLTDYLPLISGAMRALFSVPDQRLQRLIDQTIDQAVGLQHWQHSVKIGVQIRMASGEGWSRVNPKFVRCFVEEVESIIQLRIRNSLGLPVAADKPIVIFLSIDSDQVEPIASEFVERLQLVGKQQTGRRSQAVVPKLFWSGAFLNLTYHHVAHSLSAHISDQWQAMAKNFVDWSLMSQCDHLVISRSGFGESASLFSLAPTRRFRHDLSTTSLAVNSSSSSSSGCVFDDYYQQLLSLSSDKVDIYDVL